MYAPQKIKTEPDYCNNCFFFTMTTYANEPIFNNAENVIFLRQAFHHAMNAKPFILPAISLLPNHLHCIWQLPDKEFEPPSCRWQLITTLFQRQRPEIKHLWQEPGFTHRIIDRYDYANHIDYIQLNPIKQGYVDTVKSWPYSKFGI